MPFIPPMLATRLEDPRRLADPRYSAEPKLDGQRAQLHVRDHRTVHAFSRPGRELIRLPGLAWLQEIRWPVAAAVLDGEAVAGDGSEGIQAVFEALARAAGDRRADGRGGRHRAGTPRPGRAHPRCGVSHPAHRNRIGEPPYIARGLYSQTPRPKDARLPPERTMSVELTEPSRH